MKLALLNTSILTTTGNYTLIDVDLDTAKLKALGLGIRALEKQIGD